MAIEVEYDIEQFRVSVEEILKQKRKLGNCDWNKRERKK